MKILKLLFVFFFLFISSKIQAVEIRDSLSFSPTLLSSKSSQNTTVSNHSLCLNILGLTYIYEYAFSPKGTIQFKTGASYSFGRVLRLKLDQEYNLEFTTKDYHLLTGFLAVEPRFYYNIGKRHKKGKRTCSNSGAYISSELIYEFPIAITEGVKTVQIYSITPYWGFRRVWNHFLLDFSGGIGYVVASNGESFVRPALRLSLGYIF